MAKEVKYRIIKHFGIVSATGNGVTKELNLIEWEDKGALFDLRRWRNLENGEKVPLKGTTMTSFEAAELFKLLNDAKGTFFDV